MVDLSGAVVLVVDDEPDNLGVIKLVMDFHNAVTLTASSAQECLDLMAHTMPSFLLVDIQMPGMSGIDLLNIIRKQSAWSHLPVIAVTAHAMSGDQERMLAAGFNGYIPKPVNAMSLANEIVAILESNTP